MACCRAVAGIWSATVAAAIFLAGIAGAHGQEAQDRKKDQCVADLIVAWSSASFEVREAASDEVLRRWTSWGTPAIRQLEESTGSTDSEVAQRAREALKRINFRRTAHLLELPDPARLEGRLYRAGVEQTLNVLRDVAKLWLDGKVTSGGLEFLAAFISERGCDFDLDELIALVTDPPIGPYARLLIPRLQHASVGARRSAVQALATLRAKESSQSILLLLKDENPSVRHAAIKALVQLDCAKCGAEIAARLKDSSALVQARAAKALAELKCREFTESLVELLDSTNPSVRAQAALAVGQLMADDTRTPRRDQATLSLKKLEAADPRDAWDLEARLACRISLLRLGVLDRSTHCQLVNDIGIAALAPMSNNLGLPLIDALLSQYEPNLHRLLQANVQLTNPVRTPDDLRKLLDGLGCRLSDSTSDSFHGTAPAGSYSTLLEVLALLFGEERLGIVIDEGSVRILDPVTARTFWKERLSKKR